MLACVELTNGSELGSGSHMISMKSILHRPLLEWVCDHQVMGRIVCPGAAYMEMSSCSSEICNGTVGTKLKSIVHDASIPMPLTLGKPSETDDGLVTDCELSLLLDMREGAIQIRSIQFLMLLESKKKMRIA